MSPMITGILIAVTIAVGVATWKAPRLTSILFWATLATILVGSAAAMVMPGEVAENLIWLVLAFPLIWVGLQFWCYWDGSKWRVAAGMIGVCIVSGLVIYISPPLG
ncbi:MAG: hypothetical protein AAGJ85_05585 [Pseudomonadota bacterium]